MREILRRLPIKSIRPEWEIEMRHREMVTDFVVVVASSLLVTPIIFMLDKLAVLTL